jgi:hypothetical protein
MLSVIVLNAECHNNECVGADQYRNLVPKTVTVFPRIEHSPKASLVKKAAKMKPKMMKFLRDIFNLNFLRLKEFS